MLKFRWRFKKAEELPRYFSLRTSWCMSIMWLNDYTGLCSYVNYITNDACIEVDLHWELT